MHHSLLKLFVVVLFCLFQFTYSKAQTDNANSKLIADSEDFIKEKYPIS